MQAKPLCCLGQRETVVKILRKESTVKPKIWWVEFEDGPTEVMNGFQSRRENQTLGIISNYIIAITQGVYIQSLFPMGFKVHVTHLSCRANWSKLVSSEVPSKEFLTSLCINHFIFLLENPLGFESMETCWLRIICLCEWTWVSVTPLHAYVRHENLSNCFSLRAFNFSPRYKLSTSTHATSVACAKLAEKAHTAVQQLTYLVWIAHRKPLQSRDKGRHQIWKKTQWAAREGF